MKKAISLALVIILITISVACKYQGLDNKKSLNSKEVSKSTATVSLSSSSNVKFEYFFRGFVALKSDKIDTYPQEPVVIETNEDWHDFMDKYVPGIQYYINVDYTKDCLVFSPLFPPQAMYSIAADIKTFVVDDKNFLIPEYIKTNTGISNGIYAQNIDDILHVYVNIVKVNKKGVPKGINNIYHK